MGQHVNFPRPHEAQLSWKDPHLGVKILQLVSSLLLLRAADGGFILSLGVNTTNVCLSVVDNVGSVSVFESRCHCERFGCE